MNPAIAGDLKMPDWLVSTDGKLQIVGDAQSILAENADRVLTVAAIAARTNSRPDRAILRAAISRFDRIHSVPRSVWRERFHDLLVAARPSVGLRFLHAAKVLPQMLPEVCAMVGFHKSCPVHHKDIWDHTLQVVDKCPAKLAVRWTALMHDTGKVWTRSVSAGRKVHFFRHEELGAALMKSVAGRFELSEDLGKRIVYIIANHARANVYANNWTDSAVRRLIRDMGEHLDDVIAFSQSDFTTKRAERIREVQTLSAQLNQRVSRLIEHDAKVEPLPKGFGLMVMQRTGKPGGRWLGDIQKWLKAQVELGAIDGGLSAEAYFDFVSAQAPEMLTAD